MPSERRSGTCHLRATLALAAFAFVACVQDGIVLERSRVDGAVVDGAVVDGAVGDGSVGDAETDLPIVDANVPDTQVQPDAGPSGNVTIYLTGFEAYAGLTIRARLGALSSVIASAVIQPDGTAVIILNQIFTILSSTYFESYIDVDGSGSCSATNDQLAAANVFLVEDGSGSRVDLDASDTSAPFLGCLVLN